MLLLQESKKEQEFCLKPANEQFCDWLNFDQMDGSLMDDKPCLNARQVSASNANKCFSYRRYPACLNWTKSLMNLDIKFEHFTESTCYIEQYRRAKQLRIEERLAKLMQRNEKTDSCQKGGSFVDRSVRSSESTAEQQNHIRCKQTHDSAQNGTKRSGNAIKPSLPQSGYFAGRKWVYPKDFARLCSKNIGVKCGSHRTQLKRTDIQTLNTKTKMFLRGTGKPLNISCNKSPTVPRHRSACKSAPACRLNQPYPIQPGSLGTQQTKVMVPPDQNKSLTCADLSLLLQKHSVTQPKPSSPVTSVGNAFERVKSPKATVESKSVEDNLEYENIFRNVFEFYEQNSDARSRVYINT